VAGSLPSGITRRHSRHAPTDESRIPLRLVIYDAWRSVFAYEYLATGADLQAAMRKAIARCKVDGWTIANDGACGRFSNDLATKVNF
jgi:hypothetical protein